MEIFWWDCLRCCGDFAIALQAHAVNTYTLQAHAVNLRTLALYLHVQSLCCESFCWFGGGGRKIVLDFLEFHESFVLVWGMTTIFCRCLPCLHVRFCCGSFHEESFVGFWGVTAIYFRCLPWLLVFFCNWGISRILFLDLGGGVAP